MGQIREERDGFTIIRNAPPDESLIPNTEFERGRQDVITDMIDRMERQLKFLLSIQEDPKTSEESKQKIEHQVEVYVRFLGYARDDKYKAYYSTLRG